MPSQPPDDRFICVASFANLSCKLSQALYSKNVWKVRKKIAQRRVIVARPCELFDRDFAWSRGEWVGLYVSETEGFEIVV